MKGSCSARQMFRAPSRRPSCGRHCPARRIELQRARAATKTWPDEEVVEALDTALKGCAIVVLGNDTGLNGLVANKLARSLGYSCLATLDVVNDIIAGINAQNGAADAAAAKAGVPPASELVDTSMVEAQVLQETSTMVRTTIATLGGRHGATAMLPVWRYLRGAFTVWVDSVPDGAMKQDAHGEAEVHIRLQADPKASAERVATAVAAQAASALITKVKRDDKLTTAKLLYMKLGCRGDWPDIMPPDWQPEESSAPVIEAHTISPH